MRAREQWLVELFWCCCSSPQIAPHNKPQILDHYFGNVCELDLVFGFHKVYCILDEFIIGGEIQETSKKVSWRFDLTGDDGGLCALGHGRILHVPVHGPRSSWNV